MTRRAEVVIDVPRGLWFTSNDLRGSHHKWDAKIRALRLLGKSAAIAGRHPRLGVVTLLVEVGYPTNVRADPPNIAGTVAKHCLDGIVTSGLIADDDSRHITATTYTRGPKCPRGVHRVRFVFQEQP